MSLTSLIVTNSVYNYVDDNFYINDCIKRIENILKYKGSKRKLKNFFDDMIDKLSEDYIYQRDILFNDVFKLLFSIYNKSYAAIQSIRNIPIKVYYEKYIKSLDFLKDTSFYHYALKTSKENKNFYLRFKDKEYIMTQMELVNKQFDILDNEYLTQDLYHKYCQFYTPIFQRIKKVIYVLGIYFEDNITISEILGNKIDIFLKTTYNEWIKFEDIYIIFKKKNNQLAEITNNIKLYL